MKEWRYNWRLEVKKGLPFERWAKDIHKFKRREEEFVATLLLSTALVMWTHIQKLL